MTAHLMPHRRVNHTSALFRRRFNAPFIASKPSRVASNKLPPLGPTSRPEKRSVWCRRQPAVDNSSSWNACSPSNRPGTSRRPRQRGSRRGVAVNTTARNVIGRRPGGAIVTLS